MEAGSKETMSEPTAYQIDITIPLVSFSQREQRILHSLRADYLVGRGYLGAREIEHMRFVRWLYRTGRLIS